MMSPIMKLLIGAVLSLAIVGIIYWRAQIDYRKAAGVCGGNMTVASNVDCKCKKQQKVIITSAIGGLCALTIVWGVIAFMTFQKRGTSSFY